MTDWQVDIQIFAILFLLLQQKIGKGLAKWLKKVVVYYDKIFLENQFSKFQKLPWLWWDAITATNLLSKLESDLQILLQIIIDTAAAPDIGILEIFRYPAKTNN